MVTITEQINEEKKKETNNMYSARCIFPTDNVMEIRNRCDSDANRSG